MVKNRLMKMIQNPVAMAFSLMLMFALIAVINLSPAKADDDIDWGYMASNDQVEINNLILNDTEKHIFDGAGIINESDIDKLEKAAATKGKEAKTDFVVVTYKDSLSNIDSTKSEIQRLRYGSTDTVNCNLLVVNMGTREIRVFSVEGNGSADWMGDKLCQYIFDEIKSDFSAAQYYSGIIQYFDLAVKYLPLSPSYNPNNILYNPFVQLGIAAIIAAIIVAAMVSNSGGKVTVSQKDYIKPNQKVDCVDDFLRKTITKTRIQSSSGGGGGGHSGGGGGHSGGGGGHF